MMGANIKLSSLLLLLLLAYTTARDVSQVRAAAATAAARQASDPSAGSRGINATTAIQNTVALVGSNVTLSCAYDPTSQVIARIQWTEFAYLSQGQLISEGKQILAHPQAARYSINQDDDNNYSLTITNVQQADGGLYLCADTNAVGVEIDRAYGELIAVVDIQNCSNTFPPSGNFLEDNYYSNACSYLYQSGVIKPRGLWTGPAPFAQLQSDSGTHLYSGMSFNAHRTHEGLQHTSSFFFDATSIPARAKDPTNADNIPADVDVLPQITYHVVWRPKSMYVDGENTLTQTYNVGDVLICFADANPVASYFWRNFRTNEFIYQQDLILSVNWAGTSQTLTCTSWNTIDGANYTLDYSLAATILAPTTTTPVPTTTPTTTPPAFSDCFDSTGAWSSTFPTVGALCLLIDQTNAGSATGGFRNDTDTFWADVTGNAEMGHWEHVSWITILPKNAAVCAFIAECFRCDGLELMLVNIVQRSKIDGGICGQPGPVTYSQELTFTRDNTLKCAQFIPPGR